MAHSDQSNTLAAELDRIDCIALIEQLQALFTDIPEHRERVRVWNYLRARFPDWLGDEMPVPEPLIEPEEER